MVFKEHFDDFREVYDEKYSKACGKYRIDKITEVVEEFIKCGDYKERLARIKSTGCPQGGETKTMCQPGLWS